MSAPTKDKLSKQTVVDLKEDLKSRGLSTSGKKAELIDRIIEGTLKNPSSEDRSELDPLARILPTFPDTYLFIYRLQERG